MEDERMAGADHTKRELIMPWHIQDTAPQPTGQRENSLIVELNSQDVPTWMTNRGTNSMIQPSTYYASIYNLDIFGVRKWGKGQTSTVYSIGSEHTGH
jgi:hypothetical protein